ncbi:hypothetical protein [Nocardioides stalactiti]|uniref:hypothetical protein n=1 Tax=Nocardioides stalactiti TaxID=2755356 RepID=UPI001603179A|nr:hypothetical protein [Nocardioides stalactiti]
MGEVPFDRLGQGQSGRLVYQVMGENGPIFNPRGIRFMDPGSATAVDAASSGLLPSLLALTGGAELVDLGLGVVNLGLSVATLETARRLERKVDAIWARLDEQSERLDAIAIRLKRVDVNVAENNLRSALRHSLARSITPDGVDFSPFEVVANDVDKFTDSLDGWGYGLAPNLKLSSDVRSMLNAIWRLLYGAQASLIAAHNQYVHGDPDQVLIHPMMDAQNLILSGFPPSIVDRIAVLQVAGGAGKELGKMVNVQFYWAGSREKKQYAAWFRDRVFEPIEARLEAAHPLASAIADLLAPSHEVVSEEALRAALDDAHQYLIDWQSTDAGLVWRCEVVLALNRDLEFWESLELGTRPTLSFAIDLNQAEDKLGA